MSGRVLRVELRRSSALTAGALVAVLGVAGLYVLVTTGEGHLWDEQWVTLAVFQRVLLVVLWPLALGAGAWQARRDRRGHAEELLGTTARPVWRRTLPTCGALAIGLTLAYLVVLAVGGIRLTGHAGYLGLGWLAIVAVGALSLVAAGWLGMGIGRLWPTIYTAPALVLVGFVVLLTAVSASVDAPDDGAVQVLNVLLPWLNPITEYQTVDGRITAGQVVWFAGLALCGLVLAGAGGPRGRLAALVPLAVGLVVAVPLLSAPDSVYVVDAAATAEVCTGDGGPTVCVVKADASLLPTLTGPARRALALLGKLPDPPTSVHEITGDLTRWSTLTQPSDVVWFSSDNLTSAGRWSGTAAELTVRLLTGAGTRPCQGPDSAVDAADYRSRAIAADWLYGALDAPAPVLPPQEQARRQELWDTLLAMSPDRQRDGVAALRTAARTCHGDLLAALTGGAP